MSAKVFVCRSSRPSSIRLGRFSSPCSLFLGVALSVAASAIAQSVHRRRSMKELWFLIAMTACILPGTLSQAQMVNLGDDLSRPVPGAGHDYIHMLNETVDPASGNLSFKIDLPVPKGRGLTIPLAITYNSGEVYRFSSLLPGCGALGNGPCSNPSPLLRIINGWSDTFPYTTMSWANPGLYPYTDMNGTQGSGCDTTFSYTFYDPSGNSHLLGLAAISGVQGDGNYQESSACARVTYNNQGCAYNTIVGLEPVINFG